MLPYSSPWLAPMGQTGFAGASLVSLACNSDPRVASCPGLWKTARARTEPSRYRYFPRSMAGGGGRWDPISSPECEHGSTRSFISASDRRAYQPSSVQPSQEPKCREHCDDALGGLLLGPVRLDDIWAMQTNRGPASTNSCLIFIHQRYYCASRCAGATRGYFNGHVSRAACKFDYDLQFDCSTVVPHSTDPCIGP